MKKKNAKGILYIYKAEIGSVIGIYDKSNLKFKFSHNLQRA